MPESLLLARVNSARESVSPRADIGCVVTGCSSQAIGWNEACSPGMPMPNKGGWSEGSSGMPATVHRRMAGMSAGAWADAGSGSELALAGLDVADASATGEIERDLGVGGRGYETGGMRGDTSFVASGTSG